MNAKEQSHSGAGSDSDAIPFQGNAFGTAEDYASDMFRQAAMEDNRAQPDNPPPLMEVSDDEDEDEDNEEDDDDKEDSELVNMVAELEKSWELPREGAPRQEAMDPDDDKVDPDDMPGLMDMSDDEDDDEEGDPRQEVDDMDIDDDKSHAQHKCNVDRFIIGDGHGVKPTVRIWYNDKYASARAGQPLMHQESRD